tara:strand:+ start:326 stop:934 length:609 start_codon:yes stop_codon:yes gene_type:complete
MKHKIIPTAIVENIICFLDEIQEEALMDSSLPDNKEKLRFCSWAIKKLLDSKDAIITIHEEDKVDEEKIVNRYNKIDEKFYDWKLPPDMSEKEFDKMLNQFDAFLRGWEKEYNKKHPDKPSPKRQKDFRPSVEDIAEYMSLDEIEEYLLDDPELTNEERFELYYEERERVRKKKEEAKAAKGAMSYDEMLKDIGITKPPKKK